MKKSLIYKLVAFTFLLMVASANVYAATTHTHNNVENEVKNGSAVLLCEYDGTFDGTRGGARIYYHFSTPQDTLKMNWDIFYKHEDTFSDIGKDRSLTYGSTDFVLLDKSSRVHYGSQGKKFSSSVDSNFTCPKYSFYDRWGAKYEICFSENSACPDMSRGPFPFKENSSTIFSVIDKYITNKEFGKITVEEFKDKEIKDIIIEKTTAYLNDKYKFGSTYVMPEFIKTYVSKFAENMDITDMYAEVQDELTDEIENDGNLSEEEKKDLTDKVNRTASEAFGVSIPGKGVNVNDELSCDGLLTPEVSELVNTIFDIIKYAGPILVVILTILDFIKAAASGNQDDIKKSANNFAKRAISAVLLFFIPLICEMLFSISGVTVPEYCIGMDDTGTTQEVEPEENLNDETP